MTWLWLTLIPIVTFGSFFACIPFPYSPNLIVFMLVIIGYILYYLISKSSTYLKYIKYGYGISIICTFSLLIEGAMLVINSILNAYMKHSSFTFSLLKINPMISMSLSSQWFFIVSGSLFIYALAYSLYHRKRYYIPFVLSLIYLFIPLLFNIEPPFLLLVLYICSFSTLFMTIFIQKQKHIHLHQIQSILFGLFFFLIIGIHHFQPKQDFKRIEWIDEIRLNIKEEGINYIIDLFNDRSKDNSNLSLAGNRYYTGKTDLTIYSEQPTSRLLKGISFMNYGNNEWSNPEGTSLLQSQESNLEQYKEEYEFRNDSLYLSTFAMTNVSTLNDFKYTPYFAKFSNDYIRPGGGKDVFYYEEQTKNPYTVDFYDFDYSTFVGAVDNDLLPDYVKEHYLQMPDKTYAIIEEFIGDTIDPNQDFLSIVEEVDTLLDNEARYTLLPGSTPASEDFVGYFLNTNKKGYCVHFASSATLILRYLGVPARYTEGYQVSSGQFKDGMANVLDNQAHAWVEVYLPEWGWYPVDVTPPARYADYEEEEENTGDIVDNEDLPTNTPNQDPSNDNPLDTPIEEEITFKLSWLKYLLPIIGIYFIYRFALNYYLTHTSNKKCIIRMYKVMSTLSTPETTTQQLALKARFSHHNIEDDEVLLMKQHYQLFIKQLKKESSLFKKILIYLFY